MVKISLVGAGSVVFAKNLICDILQYPALADSTICLMDIDPVRLATIDKLARRIVQQMGVAATIEATLDLRQACRGAKFVITTIQVGGYKPSTVVDFEIPAKYGVKQTIADTLGVGGIFRALRSIPELIKVAREMEAVGVPGALLLNYTNPMAMNMWAIDRASSIDAVGLCHSVQGTSRQISSYCGLDYQDVSYLVAGINHMAFFLKFEFKGKDAYPHLFRALEQPSVVSCDRVRFEMMRRLGYFVTESSEHQSEYVPYFIHHGQEVIEQFDIPINEYIRRCEAQIATWERTEQDLLDESRPVKISRSVEYGSTIIHAMVSGESAVVYGNVPNTGIITNLPEGCSVEVPCLVDRQGMQPTHIGALPPQLAAIIHTNLGVQELTVEAAITQRREFIYQAVMMDPHTSSVLTLDKIWAMCDELIEAHQRDGFLGEFKPVAKNTGKPLADVAKVFLSIEPDGVPFFDNAAAARFSLCAENRTDGEFVGIVTVHANGAGADALEPGELGVKAGAGESVRVPFVLKRAGLADGLVLMIQSDDARTVERDYRLPRREQFDLPVSEDGAQYAAATVEWSGNVVASALLGLSQDEFFIDCRVEDSHLAINEALFWEGSAVEIGFKDVSSASGGCLPLVLLPDPDRPRVLRDGEPFTGASAKIDKDKSGYRFSLRADRKRLGISDETPFFMDMVFYVNALGTAHGRVRQSWQGTTNINLDASRFALMVPIGDDVHAKGLVDAANARDAVPVG